MNPTLEFWGWLFSRLALEVAIIVVVAAIGQYWIRRAAWQRALWCGAMLSLAMLLGLELCGQGEWAIRAKDRALMKTTSTRISTLSADDSMARLKAAPMESSEMRILQPAAKDNIARPISNPVQGVWWPGMLWGIGSLTLLSRKVMSRLRFQHQINQGEAMQDAAFLAMTRRLEEKIRLDKKVRLITIPDLTGPVAFGLLRPTIAVPQGFTGQFEAAQVEAMMAHELAHLKAHDAAWQLVADLVLAGLWWHPLLWWARRQWQAACEITADEASSMVEHGPKALAECLVVLGRQLSDASNGPGMRAEGGGFKSLLGRRVHRLLYGRRASSPRPIWTPILIGVDFAIFISAAYCAAVIGTPKLQGSMSSESPAWRQSWRHSVAGMMVASVLPASHSSPERPALAPASNACIRISTKLVEMPSTIAQTLPWFETNNGPSFLLKEIEAAQLTSLLQHNPGIDLTTAPEVTASSGRAVQVQAATFRQVTVSSNEIHFTNAPRDFHAVTKLYLEPMAGETNSRMVTISTDPVFDYLAEKKADNSIKLAMNYFQLKFQGYTESRPVGNTNSASHADSDTARPKPRFAMMNTTNLLTLRKGETAVCGPMDYKFGPRPPEGIPVLEDIPLMGRLFRSENPRIHSMSVYILVTAELVDLATIQPPDGQNK